MMKIILLFQTLLLGFSLDAATHFNVPVSDQPGRALVVPHSVVHRSCHEGFTASAGGDPVGKPLHPPGFRLKTIVLDAGHGGRDGGCSGANSTEKHIALSVAKKVGALMEELFPEIRVIYTRDKDVFIPLHERAAIANRAQADLFISIHCNSIVNASHIKGSETYVMGLHTADHNLQVAKRENEVIYLEENYQQNYGVDPNSPEGHIILSAFQNAFLEQSILFAEKVENHIGDIRNHRSRGVRQAGFFVLKETTMPSVLIETGYLTNNHDEGFLLSGEGQDQIAGAVVKALADYKWVLEYGEPDHLALASSGKVEVPSTLEKAPPISRETPKPKKAPQPITTSSPKAKPKEQAGTQPVRTAPPKAVAVRNAPENKAGGLEFRVQLAASRVELELSDAKWQSVGETVHSLKEEQFFKYQLKGRSSFEEARILQQRLRKGAFPDAFIVAYLNKEKISLQKARELAD